MKRNTRFADSTLQHIAQLRYVHELLAVQRLLTRNHIESIHLKGVTQSMFLTGNWPARIPVDIDILIRRDSLSKTTRALNGIGYQVIPQSSDTSEVLSVKPGQHDGVQLELHLSALIPLPLCAPFNTLPFPLVEQMSEEFFQRSQRFRFSHQMFRILGNEDMLLHQCLNFFFHHSCRSNHQLQDIALVIKKLPIRWAVVVARLKRWDLKEFAYYPLLLAKQVERANVPQTVLETTKPRNRLAPLVPLFINAYTAFAPIENPHVRFRYNILLRFLISDQTLLLKIRSLCSCSILWNIVKKPQRVIQLLLAIFPTTRRPAE